MIALGSAAGWLFPSPASADQVILENLIVQGSICAGLDCVTGESFGFDTLRLKENNTRLKFDDTSATPGFAANDWTLVANDAASGGRNYFGIEDSTAGRLVFGVSAGAPAYSMWVNSLGNVGLGTENPTLKLHLVNTNTPGIRLEQSGGGGFTAQTWDVAGNEANFFVRDLTNGSLLPFRIRPGAPTSSLDIAANGNVGFGTASPNYRIDAAQGGASAIRFGASGDQGGFLTSSAASNATLSGGAAWNGTNWIAKTAESSQINALNGAIGFFTNAGLTAGNAFTPTERLTISSDGNIGIGTTAPAAQLHTTGTVRFEALSGCGAGIASNATGDLSCLGGGAALVQQGGPNLPISIGIGTGGTQLAIAGLAGNRSITGVLGGGIVAGGTEAINGGQLFTANQRVAAAFGGGAGLDGSGQLTAPAYSILGQTYDNVGGALSALNAQVVFLGNGGGGGGGGSIYVSTNATGPGAAATGQNTAAIGTGANASGANALAFGSNAQATQAGALAIGSSAAATGANAIAIGSGATATGSVAIGFNAAAANGGAAYGDGAVATGFNATALGPNSSATAANAVAIGSGSTATVANTVSVGAPGAERRITNLAAGVAATDAATAGQLFTANQRTAAALGGGAGLDGNGQLTAPSYSVLGQTYDNVGGAVGALNTQVASNSSSIATLTTTGTRYYQSNSSGPAAAATGADSIAAGSNAQATQAGAVAIGANSSATATNAVAIGSGSVASAPNTVSVGSGGNERRMTNVASGINPTDAVNVAQLQSTAAGFQSQVGGLQNQISDNRWEARGGIALALAAGGLQYDTRPGKLSVAGSFGHFKGESGLAFGVGYAATERLRFNAAVSGVPSQGNVGGVVSGSITLN